MFEVTRKCNLNCEHCMRGDAQNVTMSSKIIDRVVPQILVAKQIILTGGEPMLVPDTINYLVDSLIKNNTIIAHFSSVVNGTILDDRAIKTIGAFNMIGEYIYNNVYRRAYEHANKELPDFEIFKKDPQNKESTKFAVISISVDDFHKNDVQKALEFYRKYANEYVLIDIQSEWEIEEDANGRIMNMEEYRKLKKEILSSNANFTWIDNTGKAKDNNIGFQETEYSLEDDILTSQHCCNLCHRIEMKDDFIMCRMEITANGRLCLGKQSSYDYEDNYYMGDVLEQPISCMIVKWQWKEPLLCREIETLFTCESILKHSNNLSESDRVLLEQARDLLMLKRDALKRIHNMYPNFSYSEAVKGVNADLNIRTEGNFTRVLANFLPDYDKNYVYDKDREQAICDRLRYGNRYDIYNTLLKMFGGII